MFIFVSIDMTPKSRNIGTTEMSTAKQRLSKHVQLQRIRKQQSRYCWAITIEKAFSVGSVPRLYKENPKPTENYLRISSQR
jgi:hypothetical protein